MRDGAAAPGGRGALHSRLHERRGALAVVGPREALRACRCSAPYLRYGTEAAPPSLPRGPPRSVPEPSGVRWLRAGALVAVLTPPRPAPITKILCYRYVEHPFSV